MMKKEKNNPKKNGNYVLFAIIGTIAIVAVSVLFLLMANMVAPSRHGEEFMDLQFLFTISSLLSLSMFVLSIYLIFIYLKDYLELKSKFTLGILFMMIALMLFALTSMPLVHNLFGVFGKPGFFSIIPYIFATISLAILAWLSSK